MTATNRPRHPTTGRPAFTLIELLVVLAILALLGGLSMSAVQRMRISQMRKQTEHVVAKVQNGLDNQKEAVINKVHKERTGRSADFSTLVSWCGGDEDRAEALLLYCRLKQNFPQTAAEVNTPLGGGFFGFSLGGVNFPSPRAFDAVRGIGGNPEHVSAALLFAALGGQELGGLGFAGDEAMSGAVNNAFTIGNGQYPVYKDLFGNPIAFRRLGSNAELQNAPFTNAKSGAKDPFDPQNKLANWTNKTAALGVFSGSGLANDATNFDGTNRFPVVYSAGQNQAYDNLDGDDVIGYRVRQLGAQGAKP